MSAAYRSRLPIPEPAGTPRRDDEIDVAAAAFRADQPAAPDIQIQISAVPHGLFAGVEIGDAPAVVAPDSQQEVRPGRQAAARPPEPGAGRFNRLTLP